MRKIVVIGATENTGAYLTWDLVGHAAEGGCEVFAAGRRETVFFDQYGIGYASVDMADASTLAALPQEGVHVVVLLGGLLFAYMRGCDPSRYVDVNVRGTLNVFEYCRRVGADRILCAQTVLDVLGSVTSESLVMRPYQCRGVIMTGDHTVYALAKCLAVGLIEYYRVQCGLKGFVCGLPTVCARMPDKICDVGGEGRILGYHLLMDRAAAGKSPEIWGDSTRAKDFCQLLRKAALAEGAYGGTLNVGTGVGAMTEEWARGIAEVISPGGARLEISCRPDMPDGPSHVMDISNARELLGCELGHGFIDFLKDFKRKSEIDRFADPRAGAGKHGVFDRAEGRLLANHPRRPAPFDAARRAA